jgi:hypothetical protein
MSTVTSGLLAVVMLSGPASALDRRISATLRKLDPDTRLEQVCDLEAMNRIGRETQFSPDRAKSDVVVHPSHEGDMMHATGGAFRNRGHWYQFSFTCKGTPDHLGVVSLTYAIGSLIPESKWAEYGLWR